MVNFLTGNVYYHQDLGVTDVNTIITEITTLALAAVPAWTNPSAGKLVSPLDAAGRQFTVQFNRIAATNLEMVLTDPQLRTSTRRAQIAGAGSTINYYINQYGLFLDWVNTATPEGLWASMLDESPELETSHANWMGMGGSRNAANTLDGAWFFGTAFIIRSANVYAVLADGILAPYYNAALNSGFSGFEGRTIAGSNIWGPVIQMGDSTTINVYKIQGKYYQCLTTKDTYNPPDSEVSVPIDQATSVIFRVLNMNPFSSGSNYHDRLAVRKT